MIADCIWKPKNIVNFVHPWCFSKIEKDRKKQIFGLLKVKKI